MLEIAVLGIEPSLFQRHLIQRFHHNVNLIDSITGTSSLRGMGYHKFRKVDIFSPNLQMDRKEILSSQTKKIPLGFCLIGSFSTTTEEAGDIFLKQPQNMALCHSSRVIWATLEPRNLNMIWKYIIYTLLSQNPLQAMLSISSWNRV